MPNKPFRYQSSDDDSARWDGFPYRDGDIVISTRSRSGTTWTQMICALLIFQTPALPAPLGRLSPWLDHLTKPRDEVFAQLAGQQHRRFIKTHTPLDGIPLDPRVTYIVTARHPLDMAVSLYHHSQNIDRDRLGELIGKPMSAAARRPVREWLLAWISRETDPRTDLDSLAGVMLHLSDAWARRAAGETSVVLVNYGDLCRDLAGQMRRLAGLLGITVPGDAWPGLVQAATFQEMRASAVRTAPSGGILKSTEAFFRRGRGGAAEEILTSEEIARYHARVAAMAPPDLLAWLHGPGPS